MSCGHQLIEHCCRLSQGLTNPEVDAGLLTDIMKQLLFSAKMMFVKAGQKSLFPLGQETGSECAGEIGGQAPRTIETPSRGEGELRQGPGGGRLTSPLQCTGPGVNLVSVLSW